MMIKQWKIPLSDIIREYNLYKDTFGQCPLDVAAFVYLLNVTYSSEFKQLTSFETIRDMLTKLTLDYNEFFSEYQILFREHTNQRCYSEKYIASLLITLQSSNDMFGTYLQLYASNKLFADLWSIFLYFSKENKINEIMALHLISNLNQKIATAGVNIFSNCYQSIKDSIPMVKSKNHARVAQILQETFYTIVRKKVYPSSLSGHCYPLFEDDAIELLKVFLTFSWPIMPPNLSCLFLIEHLIFNLYDINKDKFEKLIRLFQRLNKLNEKICSKNKPEKIIKDNQYTDYFQFTLHDLLKLTQGDYQRLCEIHQNNCWSLYIWSKLVYNSIFNIDINNSNEILKRVNKWIIEVQHDKYQDNDPLTTIIIKNVFENIIFKNTKQVLSLPAIQPIIRYILDAREAASSKMDKSKIDEFVDIAKQSVRAVLLLEGKSVLLQKLKLFKTTHIMKIYLEHCNEFDLFRNI